MFGSIHLGERLQVTLLQMVMQNNEANNKITGVALMLSDTQRFSYFYAKQTLLSCNWSVQIPMFEQTRSWLYSCMFSKASKWTLASSHSESGRWCYTPCLGSVQASVPQQDCVVYLSGNSVTEIWQSFLLGMPQILTDSPRRSIQLFLLGLKCEVFGAYSNCLGRGWLWL